MTISFSLFRSPDKSDTNSKPATTSSAFSFNNYQATIILMSLVLLSFAYKAAAGVTLPIDPIPGNDCPDDTLGDASAIMCKLVDGVCATVGKYAQLDSLSNMVQQTVSSAGKMACLTSDGACPSFSP